ncbi:hypothetical protein BH23VER1_BH23VER1_35690 [soil metagenome]
MSGYCLLSKLSHPHAFPMIDTSPPPHDLARRSHSTLLLSAALIALVCFVAPGTASAQIAVQLELDRKTYILHEPIYATVKVTNQAGRSFVLGGRGSLPWIAFDVTESGGPSLTSYRGSSVEMDPIVIKSGQTLSRRVRLDSIYPLTTRGNYVLRGSVYFPPLERYFPARPLRFDVDEGRTIWKRTLGLPASEGGGYRRYSVLAYDATKGTTLYFRVADEANDRILGSFALGGVLLQQQPQITMDEDFQTHILFMGSPQMYVYVVVGPDGRVRAHEAHREVVGSRPRLLSGGGRVGVRGGIFQDPNAPVAEAGTPPGGVRSLSDRPPGWSP